MGQVYPCTSGPADNLERRKAKQALVPRGRRIQEILLRRRGVGQKLPARKLADRVSAAWTDLQGQADRIQAHRAFPGAGGKLGVVFKADTRSGQAYTCA